MKYDRSDLFSKLLSNQIIVLLSNFFFQGMRYMSFGERLYKLSITLIFTCLFSFMGLDLFFSLFLAHLFNYIVNGQFYVVYRYLSSKTVMRREELVDFIEIISDKSSIFLIKDVLILGSFCRGKMNGSSDLDIRIYHSKDVVSSLKAYFMASYLRFLGLWKKFPIDVYCFSDLTFLEKIKKEEIPNSLFMDSTIYDYYDNKCIDVHLQLRRLELK